MKTFTSTLKPIGLALAFATAFASCNKDEGSSGDNLKTVQFANTPKGEVSATLTGATAVDPTTGQMKKEYAVTYEKSTEFSTADLIQGATIEKTLLYPGSILRGSSFMEGKYDPLVLSNEFNPVTVFTTIKGSGKTQTVNNVNLNSGSIFQAINDLTSAVNIAANYSTDFVPAEYEFNSDEVNTGESFKKTINVHADVNFIGIVKADFGYENSGSSTTTQNYVLLKFKQYLYSIGINPVNSSKWVVGGLSAKECGDYEPVYISSVDYGKVAYLLIETNNSSSEVINKIQASVSASITKIFSGSVNYNTSTELKKWFTEKKVKVSVLGGSAGAPVITDYNSFLNFIAPGASAGVAINSAAPISYTVRRLKDNTQVDMVNYYKEVVKEYR